MLSLRTAVVGLGIALVSGTAPASALTLGFACITNNLAGDCAIGEAQLTVDVTDPGPGGVVFTFHNAGPLGSSITDIYFDDGDPGSLLQISVVIDSPPVVDFEPLSRPRDLPGGNLASPAFETSDDFSADSESPVQTKGVNPGESVVIVFLLKPGKTFADVLASLEDRSLRVGIHVQSFATGGSESFVNTPEPSAFGLLVLGVLALTVRIRARPRQLTPSAGHA
jgi:hypothetical protein